MPGDGPDSTTSELRWIDLNSLDFDSLQIAIRAPEMVVVRSEDNNRISAYPFGRGTHCTSSSSAIYCGWSENIRIKKYSLEGRLLAIIRIDHKPVRIAQETLESEKREHQIPPDIRWHNTYSACRSISYFTDNRLWISMSTGADEFGQYWAVDENSKESFSVQTPLGLTIVAVENDIVYGMQIDGEGPVLVGYQLVNP